MHTQTKWDARRTRVPSRVATYLLLAALTALGGFLRVWQLDGKGLWLDEAFSVWMARQPLGDMSRWLAQIDQHPPFYYALFHLWTRMFGGDGPFIVRSLSALCGTLTVPALYALVHRLTGRRTGLLTVLLFALAPFHVSFGQETRMYALLTLEVTLALYALARLIQPRPGEKAWPAWATYIISTALALLTHNTAVFCPLAANLIVLVLYLRRAPAPAPRRWLLAQLAILLLWSPWLPTLVQQATGVYREFWIPAPTIETVIGTLGDFLCAFFSFSAWPPAVNVTVWGALIALIGLGGVRLYRQPLALIFALAVLLTPLLGELLVSLKRPIFYTRTLVWASLPVYLALATGIRSLPRRWLRVVALIPVLAANVQSLHIYYVYVEKEQWREAAALVAERVQPDDLLLFNATWVQIPFDYYFEPLYNPPHPVAEHGVPIDLFERGELEPKMTPGDLPRLRTLVEGHERVWLIYSHNWYTDPQGLIPVALGTSFNLAKQHRFSGLNVYLYSR